MNRFFISAALSLSAFMATAAMAAPHHYDQSRDYRSQHSYWSGGQHYHQQAKVSSRVNPSRDWRKGQLFPRQFESARYRVDYRAVRKLHQPGRYQQWYKVNGDYVLVNQRSHRILRIVR